MNAWTPDAIERVRRAEIWYRLRLAGLGGRREYGRAAPWEHLGPQRTVAVLRQLERALTYDSHRVRMRKDWNALRARDGLEPLTKKAFRKAMRDMGGRAAMRAELGRRMR